ncbi:PALP-domain-containing protein [Terfezia boudieri ATCC MYA-4762]|uniref:Cysteine synthase 2 n=1 Tax=Terfezia boudieri ATCC MYA-4762 TaxID=1051890 RepID=A0A3N4LWA5_9PEZI|nr:PALP-domain-containing protein [Terfezia boudieri ATCC MYA-4762]
MPDHHNPLLLLTTGLFAGALLAIAIQRLKPKPRKEDIRSGIEECIGNTPLIRIKSLSNATGCEILGKAEFLEPGGSIKDRVALNIIKTAEGQGLLRPYSGDVVYEGTVGSTGVSLAMLCRARGYLAHICMPNDQSLEKSSLLLKLGAALTTTSPAPIVSPTHFVNLARTLSTTHPTLPSSTPSSHGYFANQFETPYNFAAHYTTTGPEIFSQCGGRLSAFVSGAGTGGTLSGVAAYLKSQDPKIKIVLADPQGSGLYNKIKHGVLFSPTEKEGTRRRSQVDTIVEGIGLNRLTHNFSLGRPLISDAIRVSDEEALAMARFLVEKDGLFLGSSSAVNCFAAVKLAMELGPGHRIVTILCDSGTRHLSKFWKGMEVGASWDMEIGDVLGASKIRRFSDGARHNREQVPAGLKNEEFAA